MKTWKFCVLLLVFMLIGVLAAASYIDEVIQSEYDQRWAVSGIFSLIPDQLGWRFSVLGQHYHLEPQRLGEQSLSWLKQRGEELGGWIYERWRRWNA